MEGGREIIMIKMLRKLKGTGAIGRGESDEEEHTFVLISFGIHFGILNPRQAKKRVTKPWLGNGI